MKQPIDDVGRLDQVRGARLAGSLATAGEVGNPVIVPILLIFACLSVAVAGYLLGVRAGRGRAENRPTLVPSEPVDAYLRSLIEFGDNITPVWSAQVESSRTQMDRAIEVLTERFAGIVSLLDTALIASRDAVGDDQGDVFDASRERLDRVVQTLDSALGQKQGTLVELRGLVDISEQMKAMTAQVSGIAAQTRLLALNASIEAARVGEAGRGFSVVAGEVRELADLSATTGRRIEEMVDKVSHAVADTLALAEENAVVEGSMVSDANSSVQKVLDDLRAFIQTMRSSSQELGNTAERIKDEIAESLVHLQFQDRVGQKLSHVAEGIDSFPAILRQSQAGGARDLEPFDSAAMLAQLKDSYTMADENDAHRPGTAHATPDSDITFF